MLVTLLPLLSQEGKEEEKSIPIEMETITYLGDEYPLIKKEPLQLHLVHKGNHHVEVSGNTKLSVSIPCGRCLEPVEVPFSIRFDHDLDLNKSEEERRENLEEINFLKDLEIDTEQLLRDEILLRWPIRVLCKEDCKGICSQCGTNLNTGSCDCDSGPKDPRMAAISDIFNQFQEEK